MKKINKLLMVSLIAFTVDLIVSKEVQLPSTDLVSQLNDATIVNDESMVSIAQEDNDIDTEKNLNIVVVETMKVVYKTESPDIYEIKPARKKSTGVKTILSLMYVASAFLTFGAIYIILHKFNVWFTRRCATITTSSRPVDRVIFPCLGK